MAANAFACAHTSQFISEAAMGDARHRQIIGVGMTRLTVYQEHCIACLSASCRVLSAGTEG